MTSTTDTGQRVSCNYCRGHGQVPNYGNGEDFYGAKECPFCHGSGTVYRSPRALAEQALRDHAECSGCDVEALAHAALSLATENAELKRQLAEADAVVFSFTTSERRGGLSTPNFERLQQEAIARHASRLSDTGKE